MMVEVTAEDIDILKESLHYSKQKVTDAAGTPKEVRDKRLERIDDLSQRLAAAKRSLS